MNDDVKKVVDAVTDAKLDGVLPDELRKKKEEPAEVARRHAVVRRNDRKLNTYGPKGFKEASVYNDYAKSHAPKRTERSEAAVTPQGLPSEAKAGAEALTQSTDRAWRQAQMNKARWSMLDVLERHGFVIRCAGSSLQFKREMETALNEHFVLVEAGLSTREKAEAARRVIMKEQADAAESTGKATEEPEREREPGEEG